MHCTDLRIWRTLPNMDTIVERDVYSDELLKLAAIAKSGGPALAAEPAADPQKHAAPPAPPTSD
jgi:hypothetical protein